VAAFVFACVVFGLVMAVGALLAVWTQRRQQRRTSCTPDGGMVDVELSARQPGRGP
jgi:hypothetical protein